MGTVYLDKQQIKAFTHSKDGVIVINVQTLLVSKGGDGYDAETKGLLSPFQDIMLVPTNRPGWYSLSKGWDSKGKMTEY